MEDAEIIRLLFARDRAALDALAWRYGGASQAHPGHPLVFLWLLTSLLGMWYNHFAK